MHTCCISRNTRCNLHVEKLTQKTQVLSSCLTAHESRLFMDQYQSWKCVSSIPCHLYTAKSLPGLCSYVFRTASTLDYLMLLTTSKTSSFSVVSLQNNIARKSHAKELLMDFAFRSSTDKCMQISKINFVFPSYSKNPTITHLKNSC